ncbi:Proteasome maturation protein, partial [Galemys pyrenaicus]
FSCVKNNLFPVIPLNYQKKIQFNQDKCFYTEKHPGYTQNCRQSAGSRLPLLPSSKLSLDILKDYDETTGLEDIFNDTTQSELIGEPHLRVEYKLGL